jgi:hypothetical protein
MSDKLELELEESAFDDFGKPLNSTKPAKHKKNPEELDEEDIEEIDSILANAPGFAETNDQPKIGIKPMPQQIVDFTPEMLALTDETISEEIVQEMKLAGYAKPPNITWPIWIGRKNIGSEHELMIQMKACGMSNIEIAGALGYHPVSVSQVLKLPKIRAKVSEKIEEIYGKDLKEALRARARNSIRVVDDILEKGKESERASMAKWVIEHQIGKPSQDIKVEKTTLIEVIAQIDQMKQEQLRDVGSNTQGLQSSKDHFDTIIEQVIPDGMVVGKRSEGSNEGKV